MFLSFSLVKVLFSTFGLTFVGTLDGLWLFVLGEIKAVTKIKIKRITKKIPHLVNFKIALPRSVFFNSWILLLKLDSFFF